MDALPGDWIIRGVQGEHYPCKPDIFAATYDPAELQERRKADSELVSHHYKLDRSGDVTEKGDFPVTPDGWIKCSDRTPKTGQAVIGCVDFDSDIVTPLVREFIWTGSTFRRGVCSTGVKSNDSVVVTHWMPLPAAPKKD
ncbi:DUF551 domain-containing protein [Salmonella enterica]|nr:DUF551 domain-containing protein [Salmonella enterica subsp. enterica]EAO9719039.1 DUF551 domain-containing protein [Salmonella enterica]ECT8306740.1 DUF551 domain-containing protein [Salmonella enterica subsp. enterica serovar Llandoff]EGZ4607684.1 DUF551 domain-containing protein [Salmonella enterica subsp. enterica serovar Everleigh]EBI6346585.1 DUF551 domain-containing protein [Salmonella enterica]